MDVNQINSIPNEQPINSDVNQQLPESQPKQSSIIPILLTFLVTAVIFGLGGYFLGDQFPFGEKESLIDNDQVNNKQEDTQPPQANNTPTQPDPTEGWKTYTNTNYGFSMKYPETWFLEYCGDGVNFLPTGTATTDHECPPGDGFPWIGLGLRQGNFTEYIEEKLSDKAFLYTPREDFVEDMPPIHQKYLVEALEPWPGPETLIDISVAFGDKIIQIYLADLKYEPEIDLMISTIRF